jgi:N utilization substance protein A
LPEILPEILPSFRWRSLAIPGNRTTDFADRIAGYWTAVLPQRGSRSPVDFNAQSITVTIQAIAVDGSGMPHSFSFSWPDIFMNAELLAQLEYLEKEKGIKKEILAEAISGALLSASKKAVGPARDLRIDFDIKSGAIRAMAKLIVAEPVINPHDEISLSRARSIKNDAQLGEELDVEVTPRNFGRIAAQAAKQAMMQRFRQAEKEMIFSEFKDRAGDIVTGTVRRFERGDVIVDLGRFEAVMPQRERVQTEDYSIGDRIRAYVVAVENGPRGPEIILSRSHPNFVRRLFEVEVGEIADRTVELRAIAREAGFRTKIAVHSADDKIDPVGACVGMRGARVKNIVRELNNEKVDIIRWSSDPKEFVLEALKPAKVKNVELKPDTKKILITVDEDQLSLAIGKGGRNARLTSRLVGWDINIEKAASAADQVQSQVEAAVAKMREVFGLEAEMATKLVDSGMQTMEIIAASEAEDLTGIIDIPIERAQEMVEKARAGLGTAGA